ncbi:MAG: DeoR/GlpR family DNA-binding transcription regulator [Paracoccaceae bacterium]
MLTTAPPSNHREQEILKELRLAGGSCRIGFLAGQLGVTDETIRRNIKALQEKSQVRKVHGGVILAEGLTVTEQPFQARMDKNATAKRQLAAKLAGMIKDGDSLFLDIGSTTAYAAQALRDHRDLYIVTNSLSVANTLATRNNNRVFFAGGELRPHDGGSFGHDALEFLRRFNVQYAVLSAGAINAKAGFMLHDIQEADLSRQAVSCAQTRIVLADSAKFGRRAPIAVTDPENFDILITEVQPDPLVLDMLNRHDISLVLANSSKKET